MVVGMRLQEEGEWEVMGERECDAGEMRRGCESERERERIKERGNYGREGRQFVCREVTEKGKEIR